MRSFVGSDFDRDLALTLVRSAKGQSRYTGNLHTRSEALFAIPREVAELQAGLATTTLDDGALLVDFFEATREGSNLTTIGPAYMRWLLDREIAGASGEVAAYLGLARVMTTKRLYGDDSDGAAGMEAGNALLAKLDDPAQRLSAAIGMLAFRRYPAAAASLVIARERQASGDHRPSLRGMAGKLTEMLADAR